MAVWPMVLIKVIIGATFVEILIAENTTFDVFGEEVMPQDDPQTMIVEPEGICSNLSCTQTLITDRCQCDDLCDYYGDCCWDARNTSRVFPQSYPKKELLQCRPFPGWTNYEPIEYLMVSRCPANTSEEMKAQCEEEPDATSYVKAEFFLPIKDETGFIYKNIYCARCNGVVDSNIFVWKVSHHCETCPSSLDLLPEHKIQLSNTNCSLSANFQWETARSCSTGLVDSCPRDFNDNDVIEKCHNYLSPGTWNSTLYKNPHCAICNGLSHYRDYVCSNPDYYLQNEEYILDLMTRVRQFPFREPAIGFPEQVQEIILRLSECTVQSLSALQTYPQHLYLAVTIPNHRLQPHSCPYFGKRLETCVHNELQRLSVGNDIGLPWRQIVQLPSADPFATESTLLFYIPSSFSIRRNWEQLIAETFESLMRSKEECDFQDLHILRVCGNLSYPEEILESCDNLLEFKTPYILARIRVINNSFTDILNPHTMDPVKDVSWFAFEGSISGRKIRAYKSQICQIKQAQEMNTATVKTETDHVAKEFTTVELTLTENFFSNICISLSVICLLVTFITYCLFSSLRNNFGITLMNFVVALALGQFLIHFVTHLVTQWQIVCSAVAIATHFVWLATFAWMNLLALNLKTTFDSKKIRTVNYTSRKTMLGYFCYGWIVPFCIVSICCTLFFVDSDAIPITYGFVIEDTCWIGNTWVAFSAVAAPLAVTIIVNGVLFSLIVDGIRKSRFRPVDRGRLQNGRGMIAELLIHIKISLLMGFSWVLGFAISFDKTRIVWYTFYVVQALQGVLIMLVFAFSGRARSLWISKLQSLGKKSTLSQTRSTGSMIAI